jgi:hypothetical protein
MLLRTPGVHGGNASWPRTVAQNFLGWIMDWAKSKGAAIVKSLRKQHPHESGKKLAARLKKLMHENEAVREVVIADAVKGVLDELYDEAAREGRSIPASLRKPS